jgi:hypothetical protein
MAWHMLKNTEPYRYAIPRATEDKLAGLRVKATGEKRQGGIPKGAKRTAKLGSGGSRTIKPLDEVYRHQGLPARKSISQGEKRMIRESGTEAFVKSLDPERIVPRRSTSRRAAKADSCEC